MFTPTSELYVDSCLTGMGAFYQGKVYAIPIHPFLSTMSIVHLEAANVLVALRCWAEQEHPYLVNCCHLLQRDGDLD